MMTVRRKPRGLQFRPLTIDRWGDFEKLFGERGACGGCWCMWWKLTRSKFEENKGAANKRAMKKLVRSGEVPGILVYLDDEPVGWCAVAEREAYPALERSRILKRIDDRPVWSVVCFFVRKDLRRRGISTAILEAAAAHVRNNGGRILEGYPTEPKKREMPSVFAYTGLASAFTRAGFRECARRSPTRPIMRRNLRPPRN